MTRPAVDSLEHLTVTNCPRNHGRRGLPREQYFGEVAARLRRMIDCGATCWHTIDPQTRLMTSDTPQELISEGVFTAQTAPDASAMIVASEYYVRDVNTFASLTSRRVPVGILSQATNGHPERSARYRNLLAPAGIPFELRAAFVSRGRCWGAVHLARRTDRQDFSTKDVNALAQLTGVIADGIRTSLRFDGARQAEDKTAPGLVILGAANEVELITAPPASDSPRYAAEPSPPPIRHRPRQCSRSQTSPVAARPPRLESPT